MHAQVALMFLVRHEAYHGALWTAWLDSVNGLLPAAAVHGACCRSDAARRVSVRSLAVQPSAVPSDTRRGCRLAAVLKNCGQPKSTASMDP